MATTIQTWRRKTNRLDREVYSGHSIFAVTIVTWQRKPVLRDTALVADCRRILNESAATQGFSFLAFCFMPDHLHLLTEGSDGSDLARFMKSFKQRSSFEFKQSYGHTLWQRSYHDHVLRSEEEVEPQVAYIINNPIEAGLVQDASEYPFLGGVVVQEMLVAT